MNQFLKIAWYGKHFGEEPMLIGNANQGAGAVFFSGCNLRCAYCQNFQISQSATGEEVSVEKLANIFLELQSQGAATLDLVTPTIWQSAIIAAIRIAKNKGLIMPIVWNSNAYESVDRLKELEGLVDIYLPDFKYADNHLAEKYSGVKNYFEVATAAIKEMFRQVSNLKTDTNGLAERGLIIRHLILPNHMENTQKVLKWIAEYDETLAVSLMSQYLPMHRAAMFPFINRRLTAEERQKMIDYGREIGLENMLTQELPSADCYVPDFDREKPFI